MTMEQPTLPPTTTSTSTASSAQERPRASASSSSGATPFRARRFKGSALTFYGAWCVVGYVLMFWGNPITDTVGLLIVFVEALLLYALDKEGMKRMNGLIPWDALSMLQQRALTVLEILFFPITLLVYLIRSVLVTRRAAR